VIKREIQGSIIKKVFHNYKRKFRFRLHNFTFLQTSIIVFIMKSFSFIFCELMKLDHEIPINIERYEKFKL